MTVPSKAAEQLITASAYKTYLKNSCEPDEAQTRVENIKELIQAIKHFETSDITSIDQLLNEVALMREKSKKQDDEHPPILLMSLHAAKGLEFDTVILAGLEEGCLPSSRSLTNNEAIEEERRLFYVGITRAKEHLLLTHSRYKYTYGNMADQIPSRFLGEIPRSLLPIQDAASLNEVQLRAFFSDWLGIKHHSSVMTFAPAKKSFKRAAPKKTMFKSSQSISGWKTHQPVMHKKFGMGTIQKVEKKGTTKTFVTVKFKIGIKKIDSSFLQKI